MNISNPLYVSLDDVR